MGGNGIDQRGVVPQQGLLNAWQYFVGYSGFKLAAVLAVPGTLDGFERGIEQGPPGLRSPLWMSLKALFYGFFAAACAAR